MRPSDRIRALARPKLEAIAQDESIPEMQRADMLNAEFISVILEYLDEQWQRHPEWEG